MARGICSGPDGTGKEARREGSQRRGRRGPRGGLIYLFIYVRGRQRVHKGEGEGPGEGRGPQAGAAPSSGPCPARSHDPGTVTRAKSKSRSSTAEPPGRPFPRAFLMTFPFEQYCRKRGHNTRKTRAHGARRHRQGLCWPPAVSGRALEAPTSLQMCSCWGRPLACP